MSSNKAIIVDIDGTVARRVNREPYDYDKVLDDAPKTEVVGVISAMWHAGYKIIFVSARDDSCFEDTYEWLRICCPPFVKLHMRKTGDNRDDAIVKQEIYEEKIKNDWDIVAVFDDRDKVVKMWRELGLTCLQVDYGNF